MLNREVRGSVAERPKGGRYLCLGLGVARAQDDKQNKGDKRKWWARPTIFIPTAQLS